MIDRRTRFEALYTKQIDPWHFRTSPYEKSKYDDTMAMMPRDRYDTIVEAGCSIGELSRRLGERCQNFRGIDVSETAIAEARRRNHDMPHMQFVQGDLPQAWPSFRVDLIVLSEFLYFLTPDELKQFSRKIAETWSPNGDCVIVSFLGATSEMLQGAQSAEIMIDELRSCCGIETGVMKSTEHYRINVIRRLE